MCPKSGRVYHSASQRQGPVYFINYNDWSKINTHQNFVTGSVGLIKSKLAIKLSNNFVFEDGSCSPSAIVWNGQYHKLNNDVSRT